MKKEYYVGGITAYVMIMFGVIAICYLMGFTNAWTAYTSGGTIGTGSGNMSIADPQQPVGQGILVVMASGVNGVIKFVEQNPGWGVFGAVFAIIGTVAMVKLGGQYILAYLIPIVLLTLFANIFIFPTSFMATEIYSDAIDFSHPGFVLSLILTVFFNLFLVLTILEFVRGQN